jgi:radical SAM superfamily enzyme YgiQ (UPF0313 family)
MNDKCRLDLLLINPGNRSQIYQSLGSDLAAIENPVWAGLLAEFIRRKGYSVAVLDANAEGLTVDQTADQIIEQNPLLAAVVAYGHNPSASTQVMPSARLILTGLKQRNPALKTILVGGHVASLPERTLSEEPVDFVAGGEGPYTLLDLIQVLKSDQPDQYSKIRNLWYRDGKITRFTQSAPIVQNLDGEMPGIAWDLLPMEKYRAHNWHCFGFLDKRQPYASLYTTLGCPYHCSYCCIQAPFRSGERVLGIKDGVSSYRYWKPESVMKQIDTLVNYYGVRNIKFADELFVLNNKHVYGICDQIIARGYDLNIWAYARVDSIRGEATIDKLKKAGVNWLCFGIESASERVRDDVNKAYQQDLIYHTIERVRAAGIYVIANYMFGLPEDDLVTMQQTLDNALELNCEFANFYSAMAYPGSQLYETALKEGWPLPADWSGYSQHAVDTLPLPTKYISGAEVLRFRDQAFQVYFDNPAYLEMIGKKFGPETVVHIREMAGHKLERQHR